MAFHSRATGTTPRPSPGDIVLNCFRLERQIGAGSYATAYLAEQLGTDRRAVVKLPHPYLLRGPHGAELRRRFDAEAKAATRAKHPNLVTVYVVGETQYGVPAIAMEHVAGENLHDRLLRSAPLPDAELVALGTQLADALATLHEVGIVHRDLSPANVVLTNDPGSRFWVKLLDFGVAKLLDAPSRTLGPMGTPGYLAPEQLLGHVTPRADVYSLGAVLWWAITGREREDDYSNGSLRAGLGRCYGPDPRRQRPTAPPGLAELIARMLIPEPQLRPTMPEFLLAWRAAAGAPAAASRATTQRGTMMTPRPFAPPSERPTTAPTQHDEPVALIISNPVIRAQVTSYLRDHLGVAVAHPSPRELGRASPGDYQLAILDEELPGIATASFLDHLSNCYPELSIVIVGFDERRRYEWLGAGVEAFVRVPEQIAELGAWLERGANTLGPSRPSPTCTVAPQPRLRPSLIEEMLEVAPQQLAASLEAFIGCVPEWIAKVDRGLDSPDGDADRRACHELVVGAESVGASNLATLARAAAESIANSDFGSARVFLAACEREYLEVFQDAFVLLNHITHAGASS